MSKGKSLMSGLGLGAGLMYFLDPTAGRRRRALVRDKVVRGWNKAGDAMAPKYPPDNQVSITLNEQAKHLRVDDLVVSRSKNPYVRWDVDVDGATVVRFWFPEEEDIDEYGNQVVLFKEPVTQRKIDLTNGKGSLTLTVIGTCPLGTHPYAIYCNVNGGEEDNPNSKYRQRGRQMVESWHSHPQVKVGP